MAGNKDARQLTIVPINQYADNGFLNFRDETLKAITEKLSIVGIRDSENNAIKDKNTLKTSHRMRSTVSKITENVRFAPGLYSGRNVTNLIIMVFLWVSTTTNYSMINIYLKHLPGSIFTNYIISGCAEIASHSIVGAFFIKLTPRWTFVIGYLVAILGGSLLLFEKSFAEYPIMLSCFVAFTKFGISMAMCACYVSTPFIFPVTMCGTAFGICNIFGRFFAIGGPFIAEMNKPLPIAIFDVFTIIALIFAFFIKMPDEDIPNEQTSKVKEEKLLLEGDKN